MIAFVGREQEIRFLHGRLEDALSGRGHTLLISGEAGVGKTMLAEECMKLAQSQGFKVLKGLSMHNSLTPYMPIREALRNAGLEHLISLEVPPRLETVFLVTNTGLLLSKYERSEGKIDSEKAKLWEWVQGKNSFQELDKPPI